MKAMVLHKARPAEDAPLTLEDVPVPDPGPGEIRVRVRACGVCRTDLHVVEGDLPEAKRPVIPGHQVVGVVDKLGEGAGRFAEGDRVGIAWLRHTCGTCLFCERSQEHLCEASQYTGYNADGGYAEYTVVPEAFAYAIPDAFSDVEATPLLCAGIIGFHALERCAPPPGGSVALYGFGSSAHIVLQIARHRGHRVYVVSRGGEHLAMARNMGADWAGTDPTDMPGKADGAILFAPVGHLVPTALEHLQKGCGLAIAGIHLTDIPTLEYERHVFYERDIRSVTSNTRADGRRLLEEAAAIPIKPQTVSYPLDQANEALQDMKAGQIRGAAVLTLE